MDESKVEEIKEFLKEACNLETKKYATERIINALSNKRNYQAALTNINSDEYNNMWLESKEYKQLPKRDDLLYYTASKNPVPQLILGMILSLYGAWWAWWTVSNIINWKERPGNGVILLLEVIISIVILRFGFKFIKKFILIKKAKRDYKFINAKIKIEKKQTFSKMLPTLNQNIKVLDNEINNQKDVLLSIKNELSEFYSHNIIHEKYRELVPVYSLYEYFDTGRCTTLTGPDGAYNLYENELRQNLIIIELKNINQNLEKIKRNQFYLYTALCSVRESIDVMTQAIDEASNNIRFAIDSATDRIRFLL